MNIKEQLLYNILKEATKSKYYSKILNESNVDYYFKHFDELPILSKEDVRKSCSKMFTSDGKEFEIVRDRTSGSTGKVLEIYWKKYDMMNALVPLWHKRMEAGIFPNSKMCTFHTYINRNYEYYSFDDYFIPEVMYMIDDSVLSLSKIALTRDKIVKVYNLISSFNPDWIFTQPNTFFTLIHLLDENNMKLPKSVKYVELTGEFLFKEMYDYIKKKCSNVKFANHYGAKEVGCIAYECRCGNLHCLDDNVYVEIINKNAENIGKICVTSLRNKYFPLIRYMLEDEAKLIHSHYCECGLKSPIIKLFSGRNIEKIKTKNGNEYETFIFFYAINIINSKSEIKIIQYQVIQMDLENFQVNFIFDNRDIFEEKRIQQEFVNIMEELNLIQIQWHFIVNGNIVLKNNKVYSFISELTKI